jgi:hypothetical protein
MSHVEAAFEASADRPNLVTLLGIMPEGLDNGGYGWIEPGEPLAWSRRDRSGSCGVFTRSPHGPIVSGTGRTGGFGTASSWSRAYPRC